MDLQALHIRRSSLITIILINQKNHLITMAKKPRSGWGNSTRRQGPQIGSPILDLDFSPEKLRAFEKKYGRVATSWDEVDSWDKVVTPAEKTRIDELKRENEGQQRCLALGEDGKYFFYCKLKAERYGLGETEERKEFTPADPRYRAKVSHVELQMWCMCGTENNRCQDLREAKNLS